MNKALLDTDIFSEILKGKNRNLIAKAIAYHVFFGYYTISVITVIEIIKGYHKIGRESHIQKFLSGISHIELLTLNLKSSEIAGRIYADLERAGQPIGYADPMIAAIALHYDLVLVTGNISHYQRIKHLGYDLRMNNWYE